MIKYIDEVEITNKRVLVRADFDVTLNPNYTIADDARIIHNIPTLRYLLKNNNKLICVAKLGRPKMKDPAFSLKVVVEKLKEYLPEYTITLIDDFITADKSIFANQKSNEIFVLENIRFYPEEKKNDPEFAKKLASLADIYVNDAFAMSHRVEASVVGVTSYLPSYGGLLLKKEVATIMKAVREPQKPFVAIIGGSKIDTKINIIGKLMEVSNSILIGGGLANTFLCAQGIDIGKSYCEYEKVAKARQLIHLASQRSTTIVLPTDVVLDGGEVVRIDKIPVGATILDIGPDTQAKFGSIIASAKTIVWNGPVGYFENPAFRRGTDFIYYAIAHNTGAISIVGGGDTLSAISKKEYLDKITHISTGGGAMLELIEKGTLPGLQALDK
ncbi:phosphoglycerate kinase [Candidatus Roizmanbacteria bacterium CG03_land_8_20_14_0_80_39_12]|uniref:Phosphoglycerate kinase n=3 Tax=Candidatus Roizmaniibacteriota TaxID=1752723 RepID=A0A2M7BTA2_9BACT|nr:MAG: phosphoglycerate kinase [Candidatus Roizmanbacteria bacterium CG03_land_8_20_14_0_80_39_12]